MSEATQIEKLVDVCASRHGGNEQSRTAFRKSNRQQAQQRMAVYNLIVASPNGLTMKEVAAQMGMQLNRVSGRGTQLKQLGMVEESGEVRAGSAVLVTTGTVKIPKPEPEKPKQELKPLSPSQAKRELAELEWLFEHSEISSEAYDSAKKRIFLSLEVWGAE